MNHAIEVVNGHELVELVQDSVDILKMRRDMLVALVGDTDASLEDNQAVWLTFRTQEQIVQCYKRSNEPHPMLSKLLCLSDVKEAMTNFELTGWEQMKTQKEFMGKCQKDFNAVVGHVSAQKAQVNTLLTKLVRNKQKLDDKQDMRVRNEANTAFVDAQRRRDRESKDIAAAGLQAGPKSGVPCLKKLPVGIPEVETVDDIDKAKIDDKPSIPIAIEKNLDTPESTAAIQKVMDKLKKK